MEAPQDLEIIDLDTNTITNSEESDTRTILDEVVDRDAVGIHTGQVKWFNDKLGYGFITICNVSDSVKEAVGMHAGPCVGMDSGRDVFVHHSGVRPVNSNFHSLRKGEYTSFNMMHGQNGPQAVDVTGIGGGTLMCDVVPLRRTPPLAHGHGHRPGHGHVQNHNMYGHGSGQGQGQGQTAWSWDGTCMKPFVYDGHNHGLQGHASAPPMMWRWR